MNQPVYLNLINNSETITIHITAIITRRGLSYYQICILNKYHDHYSPDDDNRIHIGS